ncbi:MAG: cobalamin biosynthesis protein, partial [Coriobacteriaceae bacterium]|nr:cobalamin biosynthesis protein [Coriobacteriaceae bacterium]
MEHVLAIAIAFGLDLLLGDPHDLPHPVRWMGSLIAFLEKPLRLGFPKTPDGERTAGVVLVALVVGISVACTGALLWLCARLGSWLALGMEAWICYQMLAARSLRDESMAVAERLKAGDL